MAHRYLAPHVRFAIVAAGLCAAITSATAEPNAEADKVRLLESMARRAHSEKRYEDAIDAFEAAYLMKANAKYLYNIGRCQERLGAIDKAIEYLTTYLEQIQDPKDRADAEAVLAVLRVKLSRAGEAQSEQPSFAEPNDAQPLLLLADRRPESPQKSAEDRPPHPASLAGTAGSGSERAPPAVLGWGSIAAFAASGALLAGGATFGVLSRYAIGERDAMRRAGPTPAADFIEQQDQAEVRALAANVLLAAGAAAVVTGIVLLVVGDDSAEEVSGGRGWPPEPPGLTVSWGGAP